MSETKYVLEIEWEVSDLPSLVGPFATDEEANKWGQLNIPNGTWEVRPLAQPFAHARGRRG